MPLDLEEQTGLIIGAAIEVHRALGPGFLESVSCLPGRKAPRPPAPLTREVHHRQRVLFTPPSQVLVTYARIAGLLAVGCSGERGERIPRGLATPISSHCSAALDTSVGGRCTAELPDWEGTPIVVTDSRWAQCIECLSSSSLADFCATDPWDLGTACPTLHDYLAVNDWYAGQAAHVVLYSCTSPAGDALSVAWQSYDYAEYGNGPDYDVVFSSAEEMIAVGETSYPDLSGGYWGTPACCGGTIAVGRRWYGAPPDLLDCQL